MIDYDAINNFVDEMSQRYDRDMLAALSQAMDDAEVVCCELSFVWEICNVCRGEGSHSRRLGVISREVLDDWDDDTRHNYFSGVYNDSCIACSGSGKVKEIDLESLDYSISSWIERYYDYAYCDMMMAKGERMAGA